MHFVMKWGSEWAREEGCSSKKVELEPLSHYGGDDGGDNDDDS